MKKIIRIVCLLTAFYIFSIQSLSALEPETHRHINEFIAANPVNGFSLHIYLITELGFLDGADEILVSDKTQEVSEWLGEGGEREDLPKWYLPYIRSANHFHNPLESEIENAGFSGFLSGWLFQGESSVLWSQKEEGLQSPGGCYSWRDVRYYFHSALTATDKTKRDIYFAATFRGLGQLMHLVQDLSVPEHARDAGHILPAYESWALKNVNFNYDTGQISVFDNQQGQLRPLESSVYFYNTSALLQPSPFSEADIPIAWLFDANQYTGSNPDDTMSPGIGLSEYTNANFLSKGTLFSDFPYPAETSVDVEKYEITHPFLTDTVSRKYYIKARDGDSGYRLSGVGYLYYYENTYNNHPYDTNFDYVVQFPPMDRYVFEDYAKKLIPRAVGYSGALLEYFFRGRMQVIALPLFYDKNLFGLVITIKNVTPTKEIMGSGYVSLVVRYTPVNGSHDIFIRAYDVSCEKIHHGEEEKFQFYLPASLPIADIESIDCTLIFAGNLGEENNAVIAKSFSFSPRETIKFSEDWDNDLTGNYPWYHSDESQNVDNGKTINTVESKIFEKGNIRHINERKGRVNESFLYFRDFNSEHQILNPESPQGIRITPDTYLQFKMDDLSINQQPPPELGYTTAFQYLSLEFNITSASDFYALQFTQPGQGVHRPSTINLIYSFQLGGFMVTNIYDLFEGQGITIPEPFYLQCIVLNQRLWDLVDPSDIEHRQKMTTDFIRIIEAYNGYK